MQHRSFAYRQGFHRAGSALLIPRAGVSLLAGMLLALPGCLVPLPLQQQNNVDGGQLLMVTAGNPGFGSQVVTMSNMYFHYEVDVITDSPGLAGRLYRQLNGSCCDLNIDDATAPARFLEQATVTPSGNNHYSVEFPNEVPPCDPGLPAGSIIFIVPVLASGGFIPTPNPIYPDGIGVVDRSHYWTVFCR